MQGCFRAAASPLFRPVRSGVVLGLLVQLFASACLADGALQAPVASRNLSPLYANLGIPVLERVGAPARGEFEFDWTLNWASHAVREGAGGALLELDGETQRQDLRLRFGLASGLALTLNLPYVSHRAGKLDGLIDDWHAFWGMPDGPRGEQPRDRLRYLYSTEESIGAAPGFLFDDPTDGFGDAELTLSYEFRGDGSGRWGAFASYKADSGDAEAFRGSGDRAISLGARWSRSDCLLSAVDCHLQLGLSDLGRNPYDANADEEAVFAGLGLSWQLNSRLALQAQLDAHSVVYKQSPLDSNGVPIWGTLGIRLRLTPAWLLEAQFVEDLAVGSAPDITFRFSVQRRPPGG